MGQKVNPNGLRIGIIKDWNSKWYADKKDIAKFIKEDEVVRAFIKKKYYQSAISSIKIERSEGKIVRRAMRSAMQRATRAGAKGIKTCVSGRLDGAEIARNEHYHEGSIPLHTLRADIDYGFAEARTTFGIIGVKVWVYKGEILGKPARKEGGNRNVNA